MSKPGQLTLSLVCSRACTVCRRLKMKCIGAEDGPPCKRCQSGGHECIFEESNRGKRSSKYVAFLLISCTNSHLMGSQCRKHEILTRSLRKMERTLDTVLRSIGNPSIASGMISRSPTPSNAQSANTNALLGRTPTPPPSHSHPSNLPIFHKADHAGASPKLHSLPDNALNPLGLLAEASLANRRAQLGSNSHAFTARTQESASNLGVASSNYFKPGELPSQLRRLLVLNEVRSYDYSASEKAIYRETDSAGNAQFRKHERSCRPIQYVSHSISSRIDISSPFIRYYDHMNVGAPSLSHDFVLIFCQMHCNILDRNFHTPSLICSRSPFLLTTSEQFFYDCAITADGICASLCHSLEILSR